MARHSLIKLLGSAGPTQWLPDPITHDPGTVSPAVPALSYRAGLELATPIYSRPSYATERCIVWYVLRVRDVYKPKPPNCDVEEFIMGQPRIHWSSTNKVWHMLYVCLEVVVVQFNLVSRWYISVLAFIHGSSRFSSIGPFTSSFIIDLLLDPLIWGTKLSDTPNVDDTRYSY